MSSDDVFAASELTAREEPATTEIAGVLGAFRQRGGVLGFIASVLEPGVGAGVILTISTCLILFIGLCTVGALMGLHSFHMYVLIFLACGLLGSVLWSYNLRVAAEKAARKAGEAEEKGQESTPRDERQNLSESTRGKDKVE